jgi:hypothetical protein
MIDKEAVKKFLNIPEVDATQNEYIQDTLIPYALNRLNSMLHRTLQTAEHTEYFDGNCNNSFVLKNYPNIEIASIQRSNCDGDFETIFNTGDTIINCVTIDQSNGTVRLRKNYKLRMGWSVQVVYTAGYPDNEFPADIDEALTLICAEKFSEHYGGERNFNLSSKNMNSQTSEGKVFKKVDYSEVIGKYRPMSV